MPGAQDNGDPRGIAYADGRLYVVDGEDSKVYAYRSGRRDPAADFDLHANNGSPAGITYANGRFYVVGYLGRVYAYAERDSG